MTDSSWDSVWICCAHQGPEPTASLSTLIVFVLIFFLGLSLHAIVQRHPGIEGWESGLSMVRLWNGLRRQPRGAHLLALAAAFRGAR